MNDRPEGCSICGQPAHRDERIEATAVHTRWQVGLTICKQCVDEWHVLLRDRLRASESTSPTLT